MKELAPEIIHFFHNQGFVIVSTIDKKGGIHNSCKGIVRVEPEGKVYLLDVYRAMTFQNLKQNPHISITAVDEHRFKGYCLKGSAKTIALDKLNPDILTVWEERVTSRITQRVLRNVRGEKGHPSHPEVKLPKPEYLILMEVEKVVDLTPHKLRK
jgi:general stress protein 26